jgi:hypothetical protein
MRHACSETHSALGCWQCSVKQSCSTTTPRHFAVINYTTACITLILHLRLILGAKILERLLTRRGDPPFPSKRPRYDPSHSSMVVSRCSHVCIVFFRCHSTCQTGLRFCKWCLSMSSARKLTTTFIGSVPQTQSKMPSSRRRCKSMSKLRSRWP